MGVSKNRGTPKSAILIGFSIINHPFWGTIIFGNTHIPKFDPPFWASFIERCKLGTSGRSRRTSTTFEDHDPGIEGKHIDLGGVFVWKSKGITSSSSRLGVENIPGTCEYPLFWWLNPPKQGLFQSKQWS